MTWRLRTTHSDDDEEPCGAIFRFFRNFTELHTLKSVDQILYKVLRTFLHEPDQRGVCVQSSLFSTFGSNMPLCMLEDP